ncbi:unnamed protein product [Adineta ricciae]|uniref:Uncharacterized protein n=1 Tax=Adineta ricciae TaxID=249248 RepID=A0A815FQG9_ADIRI|nr:unnamed protein product [Adineta ricciae]
MSNINMSYRSHHHRLRLFQHCHPPRFESTRLDDGNENLHRFDSSSQLYVNHESEPFRRISMHLKKTKEMLDGASFTPIVKSLNIKRLNDYRHQITNTYNWVD